MSGKIFFDAKGDWQEVIDTIGATDAIEAVNTIHDTYGDVDCWRHRSVLGDQAPANYALQWLNFGSF